MKITLNFNQKRDLILKAVADLNQKFHQDFIIQEEFLSFGEDDNAWLLVLSNDEGTMFYFSVFEWEIQGDFLRRISKKKDPFVASITGIPWNILEATIYDEGTVVFRLTNHEYLVFNFAGKMVLRTFVYLQVQHHLHFMKEIKAMHAYGIC